MERVAVTGARGLLGRQCVSAFTAHGHAVLALPHDSFDIARASDREGLATWRPSVVVNCAAWTDVEGCARDPERAMAINGTAAGALAEAAAACGAKCVQLSTNEVFDGRKDVSYRTDDPPNPINPYGASKLAGEQLVAAAGEANLVVRTAWLFGPGRDTFVTKILAAAARLRERGEPLRVVDDEWGNPTWAASLADRIVAAVEFGLRGIVHLAGGPPVTRFGWAMEVLKAAGVSQPLERIGSAEFSRDSRPPLRAVLVVSPADAEYLRWREPFVGYVRQLTMDESAR